MISRTSFIVYLVMREQSKVASQRSNQLLMNTNLKDTKQDSKQMLTSNKMSRDLDNKIPTTLELIRPQNFQLLVKISQKLRGWFINKFFNNSSACIKSLQSISSQNEKEQIQEQRYIYKKEDYSSQYRVNIIIKKAQKIKCVKKSQFRVIPQLPSYNIKYEVRIYWEELMSNVQHEPHETYFGQYRAKCLNLKKRSTMTILCQLLTQIALKYHPSSKDTKILKYDLKNLPETCPNNEGSFQICLSVQIKKLFLRPNLKYAYKISTKDNQHQKQIVAFYVETDLIKLMWDRPLNLKQIDFYNDIVIENRVPILSKYLLKKVKVQMKTDQIDARDFKKIVKQANIQKFAA